MQGKRQINFPGVYDSASLEGMRPEDLFASLRQEAAVEHKHPNGGYGHVSIKLTSVVQGEFDRLFDLALYMEIDSFLAGLAGWSNIRVLQVMKMETVQMLSHASWHVGMMSALTNDTH